MTKKVALVTGGGRGLGAELCRELSRRHYHVVVNYSRSEETAQKLAEEIGGLALCADVRETTAVEMMIKSLHECFGCLDLLINNAGVDIPRISWRMSESDWDTVVAVNLTGAFKVLRASIPLLQKSKGSVVNIVSMLGLSGGVGTANYSASKAGLIGLTRAAAVELAPEVRVNAAAPGYLLTEMGRSVPEEHLEIVKTQNLLGKLSEIKTSAAAIVSLAENPQVSGQIINLDSRIARWA